MNASRTVNLDEVGELVDQLERDLAKARAGDASVDTLRAEVEQLRAALSAAEPSHDDVQVGLHGVRATLEELGDDLKSGALTGSDYLTRIGRLLGLG
jgi:cell division septum initiation protein DivIVA